MFVQLNSLCSLCKSVPLKDTIIKLGCLHTNYSGETSQMMLWCFRFIGFCFCLIPAPTPNHFPKMSIFLQLAWHFLLSAKMCTRSLSAVLLWDSPVGGSSEIPERLLCVAPKQVSGLRFEDAVSSGWSRSLRTHCSLRPQPSRLAWQCSRPDCIINANGAASWSAALRVYFCATLTQEY